MNNYNKLNHTTWDCKYHLIWIPKYRKKVIYGNLRRYRPENRSVETILTPFRWFMLL